MRINTRLTCAALAAVLCLAVLPARVAFAQSLGDVARRAEEQRKAGASKVYTNDNVAPSDQPAAPAAAAAPGEQTPPAASASNPSGAGVEADKPAGQTTPQPAPVESRRNEQYWRKVLADVRAKIATLEDKIAAQQSRLDQIEGDSPTEVREREVVSATIERLRKDVALQNGELTRWLTLAKTTKTPEEWLK